jgi:hypothetical protein
MPNIQFFSLAEIVSDKLHIPPMPFPVRQGRKKAIFKPQGVALDLLLDELEHYLIEYPEERIFYKQAGSRLASIEGIRLGEEGNGHVVWNYARMKKTVESRV